MSNVLIKESTMSAIGDAIRTMTGKTDLFLPSNMPSEILGINGGGGKLPESQLLCTLVSDMDIPTIISNHPITTKYNKEFIFLKMTGDNVATNGTRTYGWILFYIDNTSTQINKSFDIHTYVNSLVSPDSLLPYNTPSGDNGSYIYLENGIITGVKFGTGVYVGAGNSIHYLEIPFDYDTFTMDVTERG